MRQNICYNGFVFSFKEGVWLLKRLLCGILTAVMLLSVFAQFPMNVRADDLKSSDAFVEILKKIEGFAPKPYWDYSQYTVGYGTRCPDDKYQQYKTYGITEEEALELLYQELASFESAINKFAQKYSLNLTQNQFDALVSFSYNCGTGWMNESTGFMNTAIREGKTGTDLLYALCLWSSAGGDYILMQRRLSEANMYINGVYEAYNDDTDGSYPDTYRYIFLDGNGGTVRYVIHGYDAAENSPITYAFTAIPTGTDANGTSFSYEFAGWYTTDGVKVETLDGTLENGAVLYAQWADPEGNIVSLPKGTVITPLEVTVSSSVGTTGLKIRSGPGTYYAQVGLLNAGDKVTITETYEFKSTLWGKCELGWISLSSTNYEEALAGTETWPKTGVVNANQVNVRSGAGTSNPVQYQLNQGDAVTIYEKVYSGSLYWGRLEDGNWICLTYVTFDTSSEDQDPTDPSEPSEPTEPVGIPGDVNGDETVNKDDAIYLLRFVVYPDKYPISVSGDVNGDGSVDKNDAIYLLRHVVYPDKYPLS